MTVPAAFGPRPRTPSAPFALGETPRAWGDLLADAAALARRLPAGGGGATGTAGALMVACADRYHFAAALLAVWQVGRVAALPPNGRPETIDALCVAECIPLVLHDGGGSGGLDVRPLLEGGGRTATAPAAEMAVQALRLTADRTLVRVHTSGSTGASLACDKTAAQLLGEALLLVNLFGLGPDTRLLATVPPHHIYGLLFGVLVPFMGGGAFVRSTPHHAETIAAQATAFGANLLVSAPAHLHGLGVLAPGALPALRRIFSSGAPLPERTSRETVALTGTPVTEILGSTETGGMAWRQTGTRDDAAASVDDPTAGTAWQPFPGVRVSADADGLLRLRSPFADGGGGADGVRGADRIDVLADGRFRLRGRADAVVKIGGQRIATTEVERHLREIPGVRDAAVIAVDVAGSHQHQMWAAVAGDGLSVPALRAALGRWLDPIAIPRRFRLVAALPREENGKLTRARIEALFNASAPDQRAPQPPIQPTCSDGGSEQLTLTRTIPVDSPYFKGHFDDFPVLPGVVQLYDLILRPLSDRWPRLQQLRKILRLKFRHPIRPGDALEIALTRAADKVSFEIRGPRGPVSSGVLVFEKTQG